MKENDLMGHMLVLMFLGAFFFVSTAGIAASGNRNLGSVFKILLIVIFLVILLVFVDALRIKFRRKK